MENDDSIWKNDGTHEPNPQITTPLAVVIHTPRLLGASVDWNSVPDMIRGMWTLTYPCQCDMCKTPF